MGLSEEQQRRINNELPGGGVHVPSGAAVPTADDAAAATSRSLCSSIPRSLPTLLVVAGEHASALDPFLSAYGYEILADVFHSHLEDTKSYAVFKKRRERAEGAGVERVPEEEKVLPREEKAEL